MAEPIIKMENVDLYYDKGKPMEVWALKGVSIEINKGEYAAFFGPSGCGKTTMLYALSGMESERVTAGQILINGKDINKFSKKELAIFRQIGIGIVFQQFNLIPSISVLDNVALPMAFLGVSLERRREEGLRLLDRLGIKHLAERLPSELSGGQQQRVGIARALANNPPIIVCDEPLGNLDSENANRVLEFLKELNEKDGRTIIMVTHEAWSLRDAKKIFYMKDGQILKTEQPKAKDDAIKSVSSFMSEELYPELNKGEIIAKSLSQLLLRGYSVEEMKRFESFLNQRTKGELTKEAFQELLDKPFREGGLGLWKNKAAKVTQMTEELISQEKQVGQIYAELEKNPEAPIYEEVRNIREWLLKDYNGKLSDIQKIQLDEVIYDRIRNIITGEHFQKVLNFSRNKYGLGLSMRATQRIAERMETILARDNTAAVAPAGK